ncbi:helix-turn-helix domain-containing protein [Pseudomonas sp. MAHUQ-62]|uniref:helix-turn-helix domain-containing protein n=1 Tax=Pseudomonas sp. GCM10023245 TaxID=3252652 RepID=UPI0036212460
MNTKHAHRLAQTIGQRLRIARSCAGMPANIAAQRLGYANATQITLAEKGERTPPLHTLVEYAKLYVVPMDFLCGLIDDPIADSNETNQGVIANVVAAAIREQFEVLVNGISEQASVTIAGYNQDRKDLQVTCNIAQQAKAALERVREMNPEFDESWRGTARLVMHLESLSQAGSKAAQRMDHERRVRELSACSISSNELTKATRSALVRCSVRADCQ